jgi:hypothetical protein
MDDLGSGTDAVRWTRRDGYPVPVEHLPELGPSLYRWMRVVVAGRQGFRVQPEDRAEPGAIDAGVADESKQFRMLLG